MCNGELSGVCGNGELYTTVVKIICILLEVNSATPYQSGTPQVSVVSGPEFHSEHDTGEEGFRCLGGFAEDCSPSSNHWRKCFLQVCESCFLVTIVYDI